MRALAPDVPVREWLFPLYMNVQDPADGWYYVGPLWGKRTTDRYKGESTNWWALGLLSRRNTPTGKRIAFRNI